MLNKKKLCVISEFNIQFYLLRLSLTKGHDWMIQWGLNSQRRKLNPDAKWISYICAIAKDHGKNLLLLLWSIFTRVRPEQERGFAAIYGLVVPSLHCPAFTEFNSDYAVFWEINYFPPFNPYPTDEALQAPLSRLVLLWQIFKRVTSLHRTSTALYSWTRHVMFTLANKSDFLRVRSSIQTTYCPELLPCRTDTREDSGHTTILANV